MYDLLWTILDVNDLAFWVTVTLVGSIVWFLKTVVGSTGYALLFAPVLVAGALVANYFITVKGVFLSTDKDTQVATGLSIGVLVTLVGLLLVMRFVNRSAEKRDSRPRRAFEMAATSPAPDAPDA